MLELGLVDDCSVEGVVEEPGIQLEAGEVGVLVAMFVEVDIGE